MKPTSPGPTKTPTSIPQPNESFGSIRSYTLPSRATRASPLTPSANVQPAKMPTSPFTWAKAGPAPAKISSERHNPIRFNIPRPFCSEPQGRDPRGGIAQLSFPRPLPSLNPLRNDETEATAACHLYTNARAQMKRMLRASHRPAEPFPFPFHVGLEWRQSRWHLAPGQEQRAYHDDRIDGVRANACLDMV